ncbi:MAG TPA: hypothetical protein VNW90_12645 [Acetobacteraceae bacterium]|nr:hypothetical protein [Acetobacteraceae bacterium]
MLFFGIIAVFPVAVLLLVQINALRYQDVLITNVQRVWFVIDLAVLVWFFGRNPLHTAGEGRVRPWWRILRSGLRVGLAALLIGLNFFWLRVAPATVDPVFIRSPYYLTLSEFLSEFLWVIRDDQPDAREEQAWRTGVNPLDVACLHLNWGCRFLRVDHRTLVAKVWDDKAMSNLRAGGSEVATALAGIQGVDLRERSLRFAVLDESQLYAVLVSAWRKSLRGPLAPSSRRSRSLTGFIKMPRERMI